MLPKKFRLTVDRFNQIPQKSKERGYIFLNIKVKNTDDDFPKFVFLVPKFLDKRSSTRHLTKRIVEELVREKIPNIKNPMNFLIKPKKIILKTDRQKVGEELDSLFDKLRGMMSIIEP